MYIGALSSSLTSYQTKNI